MGLILFVGGVLWGFTPIGSSVGECGSAFVAAGAQTEHPSPDTYTYTPEPAECATVRDDHRTPVFLVIIAGLTVLGGGLVELRAERDARRTAEGIPGPVPITNPLR
ncbi:hypothetical protein ACFVFS_23540 [Kitasatospora sp. NPDC057692]|uniref:hypothetical protein n=1 Tax=Kitasatospora sp. NPDC057692 TaxID=3346215 RepID=UPI003693793D